MCPSSLLGSTSTRSLYIIQPGRSITIQENLKPDYLEPIYSDTIKRAGKWRSSVVMGASRDLIQIDMVRQKAIHRCPFGSNQASNSHLPLFLAVCYCQTWS